MVSGAACSVLSTAVDGTEGAGEVRSAVEWAEVRALAADGVSQRQIAARLGIHRKTVKRLLEAPEPPRTTNMSAGRMR